MNALEHKPVATEQVSACRVALKNLLKVTEKVTLGRYCFCLIGKDWLNTSKVNNKDAMNDILVSLFLILNMSLIFLVFLMLTLNK